MLAVIGDLGCRDADIGGVSGIVRVPLTSSEVPGPGWAEVLLQGTVGSQVVSGVSREVVETVVRVRDSE